jgi:MoaA/NifB/PqqE/SkfB family radical SAM enzyme
MPGLGHGKLRVDDWKRVITSLASLGTRFIQLVGGEATIYPGFCELLDFAGSQGLRIEVYSNLTGITPRMWELFKRYRVRIATSFYSHEASIHDTITGLPGSQGKTLASMKNVLALGLRLRVGIIRIREDQDIAKTRAFLMDLGVEEKRIGIDRIRGVGRGANLIQEDQISALCGKCANHRCVITATGEVYPCVFSRSLIIGNVLQQDIASIVTGEPMKSTVSMLATAFAVRPGRCTPDDEECGPDCNPECDPQTWPPCQPDCCPETIADCEPTEDPPDDE